MSKEKELLKAYRILNTEGQDFILSMANTALIAQKAVLRQIHLQYPKYDVQPKTGIQNEAQTAAVPIG